MANLRLKDVTVCAADCLHPRLAARAIDVCVAKCDFADAILFTDVPVNGQFRCETIPPIRSLNDYSRFCLQDMPARTTSPFVLVVQWDGYIVDPGAWTDRFRRFDYIGAPGYSSEAAKHKPWVVGNGGFSLRSRRLLNALKSLPAIPGMAEDRAICETFRAPLERDHGIRFAPEKLADRFCYQQRIPERSTFGFHGLYNLPRVESDVEVLRVAGEMTARELTESHFFGLLHYCLKEGRMALARSLYELIRKERTPGALQDLMARRSGIPALAEREIGRLEALYAGESDARGVA